MPIRSMCVLKIGQTRKDRIMDRIAEMKRVTKETNIMMKLSLDGSGKASIDTGIRFLTICSRAFPGMAFLIWTSR